MSEFQCNVVAGKVSLRILYVHVEGIRIILTKHCGIFFNKAGAICESKDRRS